MSRCRCRRWTLSISVCRVPAMAAGAARAHHHPAASRGGSGAARPGQAKGAGAGRGTCSMRRAPHLDCRHLERAKVSANSVSLCRPTRARRSSASRTACSSCPRSSSLVFSCRRDVACLGGGGGGGLGGGVGLDGTALSRLGHACMHECTCGLRFAAGSRQQPQLSRLSRKPRGPTSLRECPRPASNLSAAALASSTPRWPFLLRQHSQFTEGS